jgi:dTDP-4-dehydrorhamnose 3,5-epimerase
MPTLARGARWNDPAFAIRWPMEPHVISDRDANWPDYRDGPTNE